MRRASWLLLLAACAAPSPTLVMPSAPPMPAPSVATTEPKSMPPLRIELTSDDKVESQLHVKLHFAGSLAAKTSLDFAPKHAVTMSNVSARDENGPVAISKTGHDLALGAGLRAELHVDYSLTFAESGEAGAPYAESIELHVAGEDLLALPKTEGERFEVELEIKTGNTVTGGASSYGLGHARKVTTRLEDLRGAFFLGGDVGTAEFHASDGADVTAWIGHTAFDPRWIGAEVAATRAAVDVFVGRRPTSTAPPLSFLIVPAKRDTPPVIMMPRTNGFLVSVDRRAVWNAPARILVGTALAQRYLGGFLSLGPRTNEEGGLWSYGFARAVGREVVFQMGMIEPADRAAEINGLLAAATFEKDPARQRIVRGALMATALDAELRKKQLTLQRFVWERLREAEETKTDEMSVEHFRSQVGVDLFESKEIPLPVDLLGRCWRLERKRLIPFELGFRTTAEQQLSVTSVTPHSNAERAGLRPNDRIESLDYREGQSDVPVRMVIRREGGQGAKAVALTFLPAGEANVGRVFTRVSGIPDARCY